MKLKNIILSLSFLHCSVAMTGAQDSTNNYLADIIFLDSIVVQASRTDFSVSDFIDLVRNDESFYLAFRNLRFANYAMRTQMQFFNRKGLPKTVVQAKHRQWRNQDCRWMEVLEHEVDGPYLKQKGKHRYYTSELYERLFITRDTVCGPIDLNRPMRTQSVGGQEGHVSELKKLIFNPGSPSDIPLVGGKTEIFSKKMIDKYDFSIRSVTLNRQDAYLFEAKIKPKYVSARQNRTLIKYLATYFSKSDFQVLARNYRLAQKTPLYRFDVTMDIRLDLSEGHYYPSKISYQGRWNIPTKRPEDASFTIDVSDFTFAKEN